MTVERVEASEQEQEESKDLQGDDSVEWRPVGKPPSYTKLLHEDLKRYGIDGTKLPRLTPPGESPPCFDLVGASFHEWQRAASAHPNAMPPIRLDMPGEPNYCADCTVAFRSKAIAAGACRFPNVVFERRRDWLTKEDEIVGVSRSSKVEAADIENDKALLLGDMKVPQEAATKELIAALSARKLSDRGRKVTIGQWRNIPLKDRITLSFPWGPHVPEDEE